MDDMYIDDGLSPESLNKYRGKESPDAMKAVAKAMEAMFAYELIKEMRATTEDGSSDFAGQTYSSMFDMQLANLWAEQGMGMENVMIKQMERMDSKGKPDESSDNTSESKGKTETEIKTPLPGIQNAPASGAHAPVKGATSGRTDGKIKSMIKAAFGGQATNAMAVIAAESSGNPNAVHFNAFYGSTDYGLFQINDKYWADRLKRNGIINNVKDLFDPQRNIEAAAWIYRHGGWNQWTSVRNGKVQLGPPDAVYADNSAS